MTLIKKNLYVWGFNDEGQLGLGDTTSRLRPTLLGEFAQVAVGQFVTIAIKANGTMWAWGSNLNGRTGLGLSTGNTLVPTQIGSDNDWVSITASNNHCLAIKSNGTMWAWGQNLDGEFGSGNFISPQTTPVQIIPQIFPADAFVKVSAGDRYSLALVKNSFNPQIFNLYATGLQLNGRLGNGLNSGSRFTWTQITSDTWKDIAAGNGSSLGIRTNGLLYSWGDNARGQLGLGNTTSVSVPTQIGSDTDWISIAGGQDVSYAVRNNGTMVSAGHNLEARTGLGITEGNTVNFTQVAPSINWLQVSGGSGRVGGAVSTDKKLYTWGRDGAQDGQGFTTSPTLVPAQTGSSIPFNDGWLEISSISSHGAAFLELPPKQGIINALAITSVDSAISITRTASSNQSLLSSLNVIIDNIGGISADLESSSNLNISLVKLIGFSITLLSTSSLQTTSNLIKQSSASLNSNTNLNFTAEVISLDDLYFEQGYIEQGYFIAIFNANADLLSEFTLESQPTRSLSTNATLVSEVNVVASAGKLVDAAVSLQSEFIQSATISHIFGADLFAMSEAALAAVAERFRNYEITKDAVFDLAVDYLKIIQAQSDAEAAFIQAVSSQRIRDQVLNATAAFSFDISADKVLENNANLVAEFNFEIIFDKITVNQAIINSVADLTAQAQVLKFGGAGLSSNATLTATISHIQGADIVAENFASLDIVADLFKAFDANLTSNSTLTADYQVIKQEIIVVIELFSDIVIDATIIKQGQSFNIGEFSLDCFATTTASIDLQAFSDAALDIITEKFAGFAADIESNFSVDIDAAIIRDANIAAVAQSELEIVVTSLVDSGVLEFASIASKLTVGRLVNLDMKVYVIPAETRIHRIDTETRLHRIGAETRIFAIRSTK